MKSALTTGFRRLGVTLAAPFLLGAVLLGASSAYDHFGEKGLGSDLPSGFVLDKPSQSDKKDVWAQLPDYPSPKTQKSPVFDPYKIYSSDSDWKMALATVSAAVGGCLFLMSVAIGWVAAGFQREK